MFRYKSLLTFDNAIVAFWLCYLCSIFFHFLLLFSRASTFYFSFRIKLWNVNNFIYNIDKFTCFCDRFWIKQYLGTFLSNSLFWKSTSFAVKSDKTLHSHWVQNHYLHLMYIFWFYKDARFVKPCFLSEIFPGFNTEVRFQKVYLYTYELVVDDKTNC